METAEVRTRGTAVDAELPFAAMLQLDLFPELATGLLLFFGEADLGERARRLHRLARLRGFQICRVARGREQV